MTTARTILEQFPMAEKKKHRHSADYEAETAQIRANKKTAAAKRKHKFKRARWTWPNAHPRCLLCGAEESVSGYCDGS